MVCLCPLLSWDVVHSYKVQFSNDTLVWKPSMNGSQEAVSQEDIGTSNLSSHCLFKSFTNLFLYLRLSEESD